MKISRLIGMLPVSITVSMNSLTCNAQNYKGSIEGGRTSHIDDIGMFSITGIYITHGVQLSSRFYIGAGIGVHLSDDYTSIPLYGSVRYTFLKKKISPFIGAKVGYNLPDAAGFYANPGAGVNWNFYKTLSMFLRVGYTYNSRAYGEAWNKNGDDVYPHGVSASIGSSL